jgi:aspartate aminotransferase
MAFTPAPATLVTDMMQRSERPVIGENPPGTIALSAGDPDFRTPPHIREAMIAAINEGYSNYPPANGDPELLEAIAWRIERDSGYAWNPKDITVTSGGSGAIFGCMAGYLNPGDKVLLPQPTYSQYADVARLVGAEVVWVNTTHDFHLDIPALRAAAQAAGPRAKMLVLNSPNNPTGMVYGREELEGAAEVAREFNLLVLADEVYDNLVFDDVPYVSTLAIPAFHDRLLYCQSFSKTYAMTGWRLGYIAASPGLIGPAARVARTAGGGINWCMQRAAIVAVREPSEWTKIMRDEYAARRELIAELLAGAEGISWTPPQGAFYAFLKYDADVPARKMQAILRERGVLARSGTEYGPSGEGYIRIAFATDRDSLSKGMLRVRETLTEAVQGRLQVAD